MQGLSGPAPNTSHTARLRLALERELRPDEQVIWHGWQLARLDWRLFGIYLFAVPWTAFAIMWTALAATAIGHSGDDGPGWIGWAFPLFGLPFVAVGLGMLAIPLVPVFQKGRVLYVVTDRRVLKLSLGRELTVKIVPSERIGLAERREHSDGSGTLQLAVKVGQDSDGDRKTEHFVVGTVADVMGAQQAVESIAQPRATGTAPTGQPGIVSS